MATVAKIHLLLGLDRKTPAASRCGCPGVYWVTKAPGLIHFIFQIHHESESITDMRRYISGERFKDEYICLKAEKSEHVLSHSFIDFLIFNEKQPLS